MRRGRSGRDRSSSRGEGEPALNRPFSSLARMLRRAPAAPGAVPPRHSPAEPSADAPVVDGPDDHELLARAMDGVVPLPARRRQRVERAAPASEPRPPVSDEVEGLAALAELVAGDVDFDVTDTREYVEGVVSGLDPRVARRLRRGDFAWQAHLDLHGLTAVEARAAVERFLVESLRAGHRCVLVVHGRGHNSKDQTPVLKTKLVTWLAHSAVSRMVLAFTTARPHDGGAGAMYVLLRRDRRRRPFRVGAGTTI
jgi:DNA-nicking Smr family endonuclease